jgi:hypothetical protein
MGEKKMGKIISLKGKDAKAFMEAYQDISKADSALEFLEEWIKSEKDTLEMMKSDKDPLDSHTDTAMYYLELLGKAAKIVNGK